MKLKDTNTQRQTEATINIILQDEEMKDLIRKLVIKSKAAGGSITHLNQATKIVWKEMCAEDEEVVEYVLTSEQEVFAKKIDAFINHYGEDLISYNTSIQCFGYVRTPESQKSFLTYLKNILISMYLVFQKEDSVNQKLIKKYSRDYLDFYIRDSISSYLHFIRTFLKLNICIDPESDSLPTYCYNSFHYQYRISEQPDFIDFCSQYKFSQNSPSETAIYAIWFINKFF